MNESGLRELFCRLLEKGAESECVEFKLTDDEPKEIGKYISALANSACVHNEESGYLLFGVSDNNHVVEGTPFKPKSKKVSNEVLEHWLSQRLSPRIDFRIYEFEYEGKGVVLFIVPSAKNEPVRFSSVDYIRIGSITRELKEFPEKARKIWTKDNLSFELELASAGLSSADVIRLLDSQYYFELMKLPYPTTQEAVIEKLMAERFVVQDTQGYAITNLGGLLFAKDLEEFNTLKRKAVRVTIYEGKNKLDTLKDPPRGKKGYAVGFKGLVGYINDNLLQNEEITQTIRRTVRMYPEDAIRELAANALIHQNFDEEGYPVIEIYSDRLEVSNPGLPLIQPLRFIDEYQSRNPILADIMRRLGICEEKGSGIDRVVNLCEVYQLPAPNILEQVKHTKVILYASQRLNDMDKNDKIRACYQHCCLKYVSNEKMTNQSLRKRFNIEEKNAALASRIISDTKEAGLIKDEDPENKSYKYAKYIPCWA